MKRSCINSSHLDQLIRVCSHPSKTLTPNQIQEVLKLWINTDWEHRREEVIDHNAQTILVEEKSEDQLNEQIEQGEALPEIDTDQLFIIPQLKKKKKPKDQSDKNQSKKQKKESKEKKSKKRKKEHHNNANDNDNKDNDEHNSIDDENQENNVLNANDASNTVLVPDAVDVMSDQSNDDHQQVRAHHGSVVNDLFHSTYLSPIPNISIVDNQDDHEGAVNDLSQSADPSPIPKNQSKKNKSKKRKKESSKSNDPPPIPKKKAAIKGTVTESDPLYMAFIKKFIQDNPLTAKKKKWDGDDENVLITSVLNHDTPIVDPTKKLKKDIIRVYADSLKKGQQSKEGGQDEDEMSSMDKR